MRQEMKFWSNFRTKEKIRMTYVFYNSFQFPNTRSKATDPYIRQRAEGGINSATHSFFSILRSRTHFVCMAKLNGWRLKINDGCSIGSRWWRRARAFVERRCLETMKRVENRPRFGNRNHGREKTDSSTVEFRCVENEEESEELSLLINDDDEI